MFAKQGFTEEEKQNILKAYIQTVKDYGCLNVEARLEVEGDQLVIYAKLELPTPLSLVTFNFTEDASEPKSQGAIRADE